ncbi:MAG: NAD(P)H-hydrate dehydratase [Planctomycetota bacterium]|nr:MAG: NAD(P)H-hydrate dehydratase [Planctomycetota bacterium]
MSDSPEISDLVFPGPRQRGSHKGDFGRVLIVAGSPGLTGAAYLAGKAAARTGSGLVTLAVPSDLNAILEAKTTCIMTLPVPEQVGGFFTPKSLNRVLEFAGSCDAVGLGPGIGRNPITREFVLGLVEKLDKPTVIDADGLFHLAEKLDVLKSAKGPRILTPHPGEFRMLSGKETGEIQEKRQDVAKEFASGHNVICVLKGHETVVADGDKVYVNKTGNPGMATGGTGDVLTGIIVSLLGQGLSPREAASSGVYLHGLAGDISAKSKGEHSMIASDLLDSLPEAVGKCFRKT